MDKEPFVTMAFVFPSLEIAKQFMSWMDGAGEQWYWDHASDRGEPKLSFTYNYNDLVTRAFEVEEEEDSE